MKTTNKKLFSVLLVLTLVSVSLFANAVPETASSVNSTENSSTVAEQKSKESTAVDFSSLDFRTSSANDIINGFDQYREKYQQTRNDLIEKINNAYKHNKSEEYFNLKKALSELKAPYLTREDTDLIVENIKTNNDYDLAMWLYKTSCYYKPTLTLSYNSDHYSFSKSITVMPGTEITLPQISAENGKIFAGWGLDDNTITYASQEVIKMPLENTQLYAIFELDPSFVEGKSLLVSEEYTTNIQSGKQQYVTFKISNNGTEDIRNLKASFTSQDPLLFVLKEDVVCSYLPSGQEVSLYFPVLTKANSGTQFEALLTVSDSDSLSEEKSMVLIVE